MNEQKEKLELQLLVTAESTNVLLNALGKYEGFCSPEEKETIEELQDQLSFCDIWFTAQEH